MHASTITTKGQATIPKAVRNYLHLHSGDAVQFLIREDGDVVIKPATLDVKKLKGFLPKPKRKVSLAEMEKAIRARSGKRC